ncbi:MAG: MqnA/MqnD/SBP family protein, partial [Planctomycetota bacterium]|nr:MqnA/MqnD/SBP family protein [Planctomycetota bacterium]
VRRHAQEMDDEVMTAHIGLYVNDFTVNLGEEGARAVAHLFAIAETEGILPAAGPR